MASEGNGNASFQDRLRAVPLFRSLPDEVLSKLAAIAREERFERNDVLFEEGDAGDAMYLVVEGSALIQKTLDKEAGTYKDLGVSEAGEIFGEMSLFDDMPRSATVRATSPLTVLVIDQGAFERFLAQDSRSGVAILSGIINILSTRLRETSQHTATLYETGNTIASIQDMGELSRRVLDRLLSAIPHVDAGAFCLWSPYMDDCEVLYGKGIAAGRQAVLAVSRTGPMAGFLRYNRTPFIMKNLDEDHPLHGVFELGPEDSLLVGPLMSKDEVLGYVILAGRGLPFSQFHKILLSAVCTQVASAVVNFSYAKDAEARQRLESARALDMHRLR